MKSSWHYAPGVMVNGTDVYAEGGNYRVTIDSEGVAHFRVWRRPDVSLEVGAAYAREMVGVFERLMGEPWMRVRGVMLDLVDASTTWGPRTRLAVSEMFATTERSCKWLAVVTTSDAVQMMTVASVLKKNAPRCGRVFGSLSNGRMWAGQRRRLSG